MTYNPKWDQEVAPNASGYPVAFTDTIDLVVAGVVQNTWESVGPTGSGADNIWTALDNLPDGTNWIRLSVKHKGTNGVASLLSISSLWIRKGSTSVGTAHCLVSEISELISASGFGQATVMTTPIVQLDGNKTFDVYWNGTFTTHELDLYIVSYG